MSEELSCPGCGEAENVTGSPVDGAIQVTCQACGARWQRGGRRGYHHDMDLGPSEVLVIFLVVMLLFGAKRLPEVARGTGRALRIFKAEVRAATDDSATGPSTVPGEGTGASDARA